MFCPVDGSVVFFRTKIIKGTPLVQLVESFRNAEGSPRQRVVASLGDAEIPEAEQKAIAKAVTLHLRGAGDDRQATMFDTGLSGEAVAWVGKIVQIAERSRGGRREVDCAVVDGVLLDGIETGNVVQLGPQLVALKAWEELGMTEMLGRLGLNSEKIAAAQLTVSNRLIEPLSEWALIDWSHRTALPELQGFRITKRSKDRLYKTSDDLMGIREEIEKHLRGRERELFNPGRSIILYDVTNTHFEGVCAANPKARHGKNKQKRNDCRQVAVGMAFDEHGLPLAHEVFEGNVADTKTLDALLDRLRPGDCDVLKPVVVLDAGFASEENITLLRERKYSYLINITRNHRTKYAGFFESGGFGPLPDREVNKGVEVKKIIDPDDPKSRLVLCRSDQRRLKEEAMISKAEERFLTDLGSLGKRIDEGRLKKPEVIERKIGALQKKHPRVQRFYRLEMRDGKLESERDDEKMAAQIQRCGDYVLKTDQDTEATTLWELYMTLLKAERGFKMLKGSLGLRPNFHQLEARVDGHIFISVLAYHLLSWVNYQLGLAGDHREWSTVRRLLSTHSLVTTRLKLEDGRLLSIRKPSVPDAEQAQVYKILGIDWKAACPPKKTELKSSETTTTL